MIDEPPVYFLIKHISLITAFSAGGLICVVKTLETESPVEHCPCQPRYLRLSVCAIICCPKTLEKSEYSILQSSLTGPGVKIMDVGQFIIKHKLISRLSFSLIICEMQT